jgi:hypothetical protein
MANFIYFRIKKTDELERIREKWQVITLPEFDLKNHENRVNSVLGNIKNYVENLNNNWGQYLEFTEVSHLLELSSPSEILRNELVTQITQQKPGYFDARPLGTLFYCEVINRSKGILVEAIVEILPPLPNSES